MLYAKYFHERKTHMAPPFVVALLHKQAEIYFFRAPREVLPAANTQHLRRRNWQPSVLSLLWGFSSNGVLSVTVQGGVVS
jgi:hypothetical protein